MGEFVAAVSRSVFHKNRRKGNETTDDLSLQQQPPYL
jgi:hypothetical protein